MILKLQARILSKLVSKKAIEQNAKVKL